MREDKKSQFYRYTVSAVLLVLLFVGGEAIHGGLGFPLRYPKRVTGTFGEYRGIKFHRGLDMSCGGRIGVPVLAAADGYVKTVLYQKWGIGYCLFLQHQGKLVTMYGHLSRFSKKIRRHGSLKNYRGKMLDRVDFRTDFSGPVIPVRKGEVIAYTGDTGIGQAHLHFEVKNGNNRFLNPLRSGIYIPDKSRPIIQKVYLEPLDGVSHVDGRARERSFSVIRARGKKGAYYLKKGAVPEIAGTVGLKIKACDRVNYRSRVSVYGFEVFINGKRTFRRFFNGIGREETYHMGLYFDYDKSSYSHYIYYAWDRRNNRGVLKGLKPGKTYRITARFYDAVGNRSQLSFRVKGKHPFDRPLWQRRINLEPGEELDLASRDRKFALFFREKSGLYKEEVVIRREEPFRTGEPGLSLKSSVYAAYPTNLAISRPVRVRFRYRGSDAGKVGIYTLNGRNGYFYFSGNRKNGKYIETETRKMGRFFLVRDDIAPHIGRNNVRKTRKRRLIYFYLADIGHGVDLERIDLKVDGKRVKWDFDPDKGRLEILRHNRIWRRGKHSITLRIFDRAGNASPLRKFSYTIR